MNLRDQLTEIEAFLAAAGLDVVRNQLGVGLGSSAGVFLYNIGDRREALLAALGSEPKRDENSTLRAAYWPAQDDPLGRKFSVRVYYWFEESTCPRCHR